MALWAESPVCLNGDGMASFIGFRILGSLRHPFLPPCLPKSVCWSLGALINRTKPMLHCSGIRNPAALAGKWQNRMVTANGDGITIVSFPLIWLSRRIIVSGNNREYDFQMSYQCLRRGHMDSAEFTEDFKAEKQIDGAKSYGENR